MDKKRILMIIAIVLCIVTLTIACSNPTNDTSSTTQENEIELEPGTNGSNFDFTNANPINVPFKAAGSDTEPREEPGYGYMLLTGQNPVAEPSTAGMETLNTLNTEFKDYGHIEVDITIE